MYKVLENRLRQEDADEAEARSKMLDSRKREPAVGVLGEQGSVSQNSDEIWDGLYRVLRTL